MITGNISFFSLCMALHLCTKLSGKVFFTVRKVFYLYIFKTFGMFLRLVKPYTILNGAIGSHWMVVQGSQFIVIFLAIFSNIETFHQIIVKIFMQLYFILPTYKTIARTRKLNPENYRFLSPQNDDISHIINI